MPWLAKQNEAERETERENYLSHGICLLKQESGSESKSHGKTKYLCRYQVLDSVLGVVFCFVFFFNVDLQLNPPTHCPDAFQTPTLPRSCTLHAAHVGTGLEPLWLGAARVPLPLMPPLAFPRTHLSLSSNKPWGRAPLALTPLSYLSLEALRALQFQPPGRDRDACSPRPHLEKIVAGAFLFYGNSHSQAQCEYALHFPTRLSQCLRKSLK